MGQNRFPGELWGSWAIPHPKEAPGRPRGLTASILSQTTLDRSPVPAPREVQLHGGHIEVAQGGGVAWFDERLDPSLAVSREPAQLGAVVGGN